MGAAQCTLAAVVLRVLSWNLFHGRAVPGAGRELSAEFAGAIAGWSWDVALLQEVPPWWPDRLGAATDATACSVLTSRNAGLRLRRAIATRWPDRIKSGGGGANAILVRGPLRVEAHRSAPLRRIPERRWLHAVRVEPVGTWIGNLHAQGSAGEAERAAARLSQWAGPSEPAVLGGDFNLAVPPVPGFTAAGGRGVDLVFARGWRGERVEVLERGALSDHAPVIVTLAR